MDPRLVHPEDRRRDGGSDVGCAGDDEVADTVPACYRSEAFAEDLSPDERGLLPSLPRQRRSTPLTVTRPAAARKPLLGLAWVAFGLRGALRD